MKNLTTIRGNNKIEKLNVLNEMRANEMTLQELRFLSIYLSKINARDVNTKAVKFPLVDFQRIMDLDRPKIKYLKESTRRLLQNVIEIPKKNGGYRQVSLFVEADVDQEKNGDWYVTIQASEKAYDLFFDFKEKYFTYELWNALRLKSVNQIRMYEIIKQHEKQKAYTFELQELRGLLGIKENEYARFSNFKIKVLEACKTALQENTDIKYEYELVKKGAKVIAVTFYISKNKDYKDPLQLENFLDIENIKTIEADFKELEFVEEKLSYNNKKLEFLADSCSNEFTEEEMQVLFDLISNLQVNSSDDVELVRYRYLKSKYNEMNLRKPNKSRFGYLKTLIIADVEGGVLIG